MCGPPKASAGTLISNLRPLTAVCRSQKAALLSAQLMERLEAGAAGRRLYIVDD